MRIRDGNYPYHLHPYLTSLPGKEGEGDGRERRAPFAATRFCHHYVYLPGHNVNISLASLYQHNLLHDKPHATNTCMVCMCEWGRNRADCKVVIYAYHVPLAFPDSVGNYYLKPTWQETNFCNIIHIYTDGCWPVSNWSNMRRMTSE